MSVCQLWVFLKEQMYVYFSTFFRHNTAFIQLLLLSNNQNQSWTLIATPLFLIENNPKQGTIQWNFFPSDGCWAGLIVLLCCTAVQQYNYCKAI